MKENENETLSTKRARQGALGRPVLLVLIGALLLAVIAFGAMQMFGESIDEGAADQPGGVTTTPPAVDKPATQQPSGLTEPAPAQ